jgi:hypothetical protein
VPILVFLTATQNTKATSRQIKEYSIKPCPSSSATNRLRSSIIIFTPFQIGPALCDPEFSDSSLSISFHHFVGYVRLHCGFSSFHATPSKIEISGPYGGDALWILESLLTNLTEASNGMSKTEQVVDAAIRLLLGAKSGWQLK